MCNKCNISKVNEWARIIILIPMMTNNNPIFDRPNAAPPHQQTVKWYDECPAHANVGCFFFLISVKDKHYIRVHRQLSVELIRLSSHASLASQNPPLALEDWCGTLCATSEWAECILHSWVTNPHDVIAMFTQHFYCNQYSADKEQIKPVPQWKSCASTPPY